MSGFYSKDLILEISFSKHSIETTFSYWLGTLSAGLTAFYSFRILYYTFWTKTNAFKFYLQNMHELPRNMAFSLGILSVGSLFSGYLLKDAFVGMGNLFWGNSIYKLDTTSNGLDLEFIPLAIKNLPLIFSLFGIFLGILLNYILNLGKYVNKNKYEKLIISYPQNFYLFFWFFYHKWYFDYVYNYYFGYTLLNYSYGCFYKLIDKGFIEILSPNGLSSICYKLCIQISYTQLGIIYHLSYFLFLGLLVLLIVIIII